MQKKAIILYIMKKKASKKANHYIDNKQFFEAMCEWKAEIIKAEDQGEGRPPISEYVGSCFIKIAEHLAQKPNFTTRKPLSMPRRAPQCYNCTHACTVACTYARTIMRLLHAHIPNVNATTPRPLCSRPGIARDH